MRIQILAGCWNPRPARRAGGFFRNLSTQGLGTTRLDSANGWSMYRLLVDSHGFAPKVEKMIRLLKEKGIRNEKVLEAMAKVPRHLFVDVVLYDRAYEDGPLPIGAGQTISQPYTVAFMTELLLGNEARFPRKVLEIGTGSGYQTAVLEKVGIKDIYSVERIKALHEKAKINLRAAKCNHSRLIFDDGSKGLPKNGPYDGIIVTAGAKSIPDELLSQLSEGGRLVIPTDNPEKGGQELIMVERSGYRYVKYNAGPVNFVPLLGGIEE